MAKIAVIGDIMLDTYHFGSWKQVNPGDIATIMIDRTIHYLGGAAAVANNVKNLGHDTFLFGYVGTDSAGNIIENKLEKSGIWYFLFRNFKQTIHKTRINQIIRFDEEIIEEAEEPGLFKLLKKSNPDIIIISDFAKGTINQKLINKIMKLKKIVLVDPKGLDYSGAFLIKPNLIEARKMTGKENEYEIIKELKKKYKNILLTKGKNGMTLYEGNKKPYNLPAEEKEMYDTTGAGDTAMAVIAVSLAEEATLKEACKFGNKAAGIVVKHIGQYNLKREDCLDYELFETSKSRTKRN